MKYREKKIEREREKKREREIEKEREKEREKREKERESGKSGYDHPIIGKSYSSTEILNQPDGKQTTIQMSLWMVRKK